MAQKEIQTMIKDDAQLEWALKRIDELLPLVTDETPKDDPNCIELMLITNCVEEYESVHCHFDIPSLPDLIRLRMEERGLTLQALASMIGVSIKSLKAYISGEEEPTLKIGGAISKELDIEPALVLGIH